MRTANALEIRNRLGSILDELERTGEPVLVSKGRKVRAVLISPADFERRFLDRQAEEKRQALLDRIRGLRSPSRTDRGSLAVLRELRGYPG